MSGIDLAYQYPLQINGCFIVENIITNSNKTINIFNYPIPVGTTRDILAIPGISESDIRESLLKGELKLKLLAKEIRVVCSDIELIQFNDAQKKLLMNAGIDQGLDIGPNEALIYRRDIILVGATDNINTQYTLPSPDTIFLYNSDKKIIVYLNGIKQAITSDYIIAESNGPGTGYTTVIFNNAPQTQDLVTADYYIA